MIGIDGVNPEGTNLQTVIQLIKCILQHSCGSSLVWDCEGYNVLGNLAQLCMIMSAGVTVVSLCVFTWGVNVFLKFCKILVSIRFVEFVIGSFSCFNIEVAFLNFTLCGA